MRRNAKNPTSFDPVVVNGMPIDLGTKWSFIAKRGTNCSKLRICSGPNWSLMDDFGTIVPKNVFLLITRERFPKYKGRCLLLDE